MLNLNRYGNKLTHNHIIICECFEYTFFSENISYSWYYIFNCTINNIDVQIAVGGLMMVLQ